MLSFPTLILLLLTATNFAAAVPPKFLPPGDPFADPKNDIYNPLRYIASDTLTGIAVAIVLVIGLIQTYCVVKYRTKFMLAMTIGCYTFATGLSLRFGLSRDPHSRGLYISQYLLVVLSPCAFIAAEYVLLGRLATYLRADKHLLVGPRKITWTFVGSDISTFLIQAIGGSVSLSSNDQKINLAGSRVFLAGLSLQLLSFLIFTTIFLTFLHKVYKHEPAIWTKDKDEGKKWHRDWRVFSIVIFISCIGVLIRSGFRVAELSEGYLGPLVTSEPLFYLLDTLPLVIAIGCYLPPFWPGMIIRYDVPVDKPATPDSEVKL